MYDPRCEDLALVFLPERSFPTRARYAAALAQTIQTAIEDWFETHVRDVERDCAIAAAHDNSRRDH
jgi:hypothetical protein